MRRFDIGFRQLGKIDFIENRKAAELRERIG